MSAYLQITMRIDESDRPAAAAVYSRFRQPFLDTIPGAVSKELLIRPEDVQVLHGFTSEPEARAYLESELLRRDVVGALKPLLKADPDVRVYTVA